jgi:hypothetical protein
MAQYAELELSLERQGADSFAVELRLSLPDSDPPRMGAAWDKTCFRFLVCASLSRS